MRGSLALLALVFVGATQPSVPNDSQPYWSPDARQLAFDRETTTRHVLFTPVVTGDEADIIGEGAVRGYRPGGRELLVTVGATTSVRDTADRQIATIDGTDATWSPDGTRVAYVRGTTLYAADASGANEQQLADGLTGVPADVNGPVWSPDGTQVAFATTGGLVVAQADGSDSKVVDTDVGANPSWSANGSWIAFERDGAIWLVHPNGADPTQVLSGDPGYRFPQWAPDGDRLAYVRGHELDVVTVGERPQTLLTGVDSESPPHWSPDGTQLAVAANGECKRLGITVVQSELPAQPRRRSNQCRFDGTPGGDYIATTPYLDIVNTFAGNDRIIAGNGDDRIDAGPGNDSVSAGPGNDLVYGGPGNDILSGGTGDDVVYAGPGRDKIGCGPGRDTAYIGPGDTVRDCERVIRTK